jgi:dTDP-4-amino-4,6-dideoxygalactose transaminase
VELDAKIRTLRDHGQAKKYCHSEIGWNARMDGIQGAVLSVKLKHVETWNAARRKNANVYNELLRDSGMTLPAEAGYAKHVYHVYAVRVKNRDQVLGALAEKGISCGIHYPVPIHLQSAYCSLNLGVGSFPVAESCASNFFLCPCFPNSAGDK